MKKIPEAIETCPACPIEVRDLFAVAHNIIVRTPSIAEGDLMRAVERMQPLIDRHFANPDHSHPRAAAKAPAARADAQPSDKWYSCPRCGTTHFEGWQAECMRCNKPMPKPTAASPASTPEASHQAGSTTQNP